MPRMVHKNHNKDGNEGGASKDENGEGMKKGPWTQAEDSMLREYVMKYGEGNWNSVQKNSGLARCGKSCRLRWANHLRPNLKKGAFSREEEQIIIHLHAKLGSKWAQMAAQLPGRTDNEIKNFWNTRMKRRQRAGLPLYPPEVFIHEPNNNTYHLQQQKHKQNFRSQPHSSSSLSFSTLLSSSYPQELNTLCHSSTANPQQNAPNFSSYINSHPQFKSPNDKSGMVLPPSTVSSHGYSFSQCNSMGRSPQQDSHSSSQSAQDGSTTPTSSHASGVYGLVGASSGVANGYYEDAQVVEAQSLSHNDKLMSEVSTTEGKKLSCNKRKSMAQEDDTVLVETTMENSGNITNKKQRNDMSSSQILSGKKLIYEDSMEELNSMDDDLFSLLNNFPSEVPVPGWYRNGERQSLGLETQQDASSSSPTGQEFAWSLGNFWSNVPNIC